MNGGPWDVAGRWEWHPPPGGQAAEMERARLEMCGYVKLVVGVWEAFQAEWSKEDCLVPRKVPSHWTLLFCAQVGKEKGRL